MIGEGARDTRYIYWIVVVVEVDLRRGSKGSTGVNFSRNFSHVFGHKPLGTCRVILQW